MSTSTLNLTPTLRDYLIQHGTREADILVKLREETATMHGAVMQICPEQGQFMAFLAKLINAKKVLEVGTFTGYSSLVVAMALPADGQLVTCDVSTECTDVAKRYWQEAGVQDKVILKIQPALDSLQELIADGQAGTFDFAFIDADKGNYSEYYELSLQLLRPGGVIAVDNVLWSGAVADDSVDDKQTNAIRAINELIHQDERVEISMLPIGDGLNLAMKR